MLNKLSAVFKERSRCRKDSAGGTWGGHQRVTGDIAESQQQDKKTLAGFPAFGFLFVGTVELFSPSAQTDRLIPEQPDLLSLLYQWLSIDAFVTGRNLMARAFPECTALHLQFGLTVNKMSKNMMVFGDDCLICSSG